ncbi:hypothetical protein L1987_16965 [Smallanthus sonchifolius]|uniref:Uncharacterized protein n=1 Tax=Smallanthus sonchifolius TaxID=185202 RepID=A0ACB9IVJ4_9ASTR|nr:hypothetical protein L1987_16965 [Smallanthus sonchifolius]
MWAKKERATSEKRLSHEDIAMTAEYAGKAVVATTRSLRELLPTSAVDGALDTCYCSTPEFLPTLVVATASNFLLRHQLQPLVEDDGNEKIGPSRKAQKIDGNHEATSKERKGAPIPVAYFPIGSNFSRL